MSNTLKVPVGSRIEFLGFGVHDPYSKLQPGTKGTVTLVDDRGTIHVDWDGGGNLGLITEGPEPDRWRLVGDE